VHLVQRQVVVVDLERKRTLDARVGLVETHVRLVVLLLDLHPPLRGVLVLVRGDKDLDGNTQVPVGFRFDDLLGYEAPTLEELCFS
jgi:hypothetical protein